MAKYKLTQDLTILDKTVLTRDSEVEFDESGEFIVNSELGPIKLTKEILKDKITSLEKNVEFKVSLLNEDDEDKVNFYRMQLDIKSTRRKIREIENEFRKILNEVL
jgi:hypothetical protein